MKNIILIHLLFVVNIICYSQSTYHLIENDIDEFNGSRKIKVNTWGDKLKLNTHTVDIENKILFTISYIESNDIEAYSLNMYVFGISNLGCLSEYKSKVILLFEDKSTLELSQISTTDCSSEGLKSRLLFISRDDLKKENWIEIMNENINTVTSKNIYKFRIYGTNGYSDYVIKESHKRIIRDGIYYINSFL